MRLTELLNGPLTWVDTLLPADTLRIQVAMWLLVLSVVLYGGWEFLLRRGKRPSGEAALIVLPGGHLPPGERYSLNGHAVTIGANEAADVRLASGVPVAGRATITPHGASYWLSSKERRSGPTVNGRPVPRDVPLRDGDLLELPGQAFRFYQEPAGRWRPQVAVWFLLFLGSLLFSIPQWAAWSFAGAGRPTATALTGWTAGLTLGAWAVTLLLRRRRATPDPVLLPVIMALLGLGLGVLLRTRPDLYERQAWAAAMGMAVLAGMALFPLKALARYRYLALVAGLGLLVATVLFGREAGGQRLAVSVLGMEFQPAEPAKLLLAVFLAGLLSERQELVSRSGRSWALTRSDARYMGPMLVAWGVALGLLIVQRDLGTALLFFGLFVAFVGMASGRVIFVVLCLVAFAFATALSVLAFDRVRLRISLWLDPWQDPQGLGYQLSQALYALAAGGVRGVGLGRGFPSLVPAAHTDLPMAIIGEELGLVGSVGVLALVLLLVVRGYQAALRSQDDFLGLLAAGLSTAVALQTFVIVGGLVRLLPLTGVTLPFISFGGASLVTNMALVGILLGISKAPAHSESAQSFRVPVGWQRQFRPVMLAAGLGFVALGAGLAYWQVHESKALTANGSNPRFRILTPQLQRGKILSVHGQVLAESVYKDGEYRRWVKAGSLMAPILGYTSQRHGKTGVEGAADAVLSGRNRVRNIADALRREASGKTGDTVRLTLNLGLQQAAALALGKRRGSVVALDPRTGAVRAMVSNPRSSYPRIDENWDRFLSDPLRPLVFRATRGIYPPGSSFKPVTAAIALGTGLMKADTVFYCPGSASIGGYTWRCFGGTAHGRLTLAEALRVSCNVTFGKIGQRLGKKRLVEGARRFGIGDTPPLALETSPGLLDPNPQPWPAVPVQLGYGQGPLAVTPLQMAMVAAAIANDGVMMKPYVVADYETPGGTVFHRTQPEVWRQATHAGTARQVRQMMTAVVRNGTGVRAQLPGLAVAGKTGTAENPHGEDHAWFISFAPAQNPKLAVAVMVENGGQGGRTAAPIARQVLAAHFGIKDTGR